MGPTVAARIHDDVRSRRCTGGIDAGMPAQRVASVAADAGLDGKRHRAAQHVAMRGEILLRPARDRANNRLVVYA